jgi:hypothetical protein
MTTFRGNWLRAPCALVFQCLDRHDDIALSIKYVTVIFSADCHAKSSRPFFEFQRQATGKQPIEYSGGVVAGRFVPNGDCVVCFASAVVAGVFSRRAEYAVMLIELEPHWAGFRAVCRRLRW